MSRPFLAGSGDPGRFHLQTLGRLALLASDGTTEPSLTTRRRKLAVLAVLALSDRPLERDALVGLFWPEQAEAKARHSLSDTLSHLRRVLGREALVTTGSAVALAPDAPLDVDARLFADACREGRHADAVAIYGGAFLQSAGFPGASPRFEHWADGERARLERLFAAACEKECLALMRGRAFERCAELAGRWLEAAPFAEQAALYRLNALKAPGTPAALAAAVGEYERLTRWLAAECECEPAPAVTELAARIREQLRELRPSPVAVPVVPPPDASPARPAPRPARTEPSSTKLLSESYTWAVPAGRSPVSPPPTPVGAPAAGRRPRLPWPRTARARRAGVAGVALALLAAAGAVLALRPDRAAGRPSAPPAIAIAGLADAHGDTAEAWLTEGLAQMIAAKLGHSGDVEVVAPERVRELKQRAGIGAGPLGAAALADLGRRLGATWVVGGRLQHADTVFSLELEVHDLAAARVVRRETVRARNALALADLVAARLLFAAGAESGGPRLADIETASLEAYERFARALEAQAQGRDREYVRELDAAIAADSGFITAVRRRAMVAFTEGEHDVFRTLTAVFHRYEHRATDWDRLELDTYAASHGGDHARAEALGRALVARYPRDPRAYAVLAGIYLSHGRWNEVEETLQHALALDSLAAEAGRGACVPCNAFPMLVEERLMRGDLVGAERAARRWIQLQPDVAPPWTTLATVLAAQQRVDEAVDATRRAMALSGGEVVTQDHWLRMLVIARRHDAADSVIADWKRGPRERRMAALDVEMLLARERGQFRRANALLDALLAEFPERGELELVRWDNLARLGEWTALRRSFAAVARRSSIPDSVVAVAAGGGPVPVMAGDEARAHSWHRSLFGDALAGSGDTVTILALADSVQRTSRRSYYGRDWGLHHHLRGLVAARAGRWVEAERELQQARWGVTGWTRTLAELADAQLAQGRAADAVTTLRWAYGAPLNAMGRYLPRSEVDYRMALAFAAAQQPDSARAYADRARAAWQEAEPVVRPLLARLDSLVPLR